MLHNQRSGIGLSPRVFGALTEASEARGANAKLHITESTDSFIPDAWRGNVAIERAEGEVIEPQTEEIQIDEIGVEWEWENSPEVTLVVVESVSEAITSVILLSAICCEHGYRRRRGI
ncbi:MAG: hypothetical protein Ct9H90mP30_0210 [Actinomycetota bacterium]|nr:MAG: hypothetical protein Ct9H90mP30_0210 [Actinomycetota bacterium]